MIYADNSVTFVRFQTPAEEIYTAASRSAIAPNLCVSNSSGENLHSVRNSIFLGYEY